MVDDIKYWRELVEELTRTLTKVRAENERLRAMLDWIFGIANGVHGSDMGTMDIWDIIEAELSKAPKPTEQEKSHAIGRIVPAEDIIYPSISNTSAPEKQRADDIGSIRIWGDESGPDPLEMHKAIYNALEKKKKNKPAPKPTEKPEGVE